MLAFTSLYFLESGLINGLRPFGVKNFPALRPDTHITRALYLSLLSQHPHATRFWFDDRKQYKSDFCLMEEIVCIFGLAQRFKRIRRIGRPGRMEVFFEVFSSRQQNAMGKM
jgi:hypothetical protein